MSRVVKHAQRYNVSLVVYENSCCLDKFNTLYEDKHWQGLSYLLKPLSPGFGELFTWKLSVLLEREWYGYTGAKVMSWGMSSHSLSSSTVTFPRTLSVKVTQTVKNSDRRDVTTCKARRFVNICHHNFHSSKDKCSLLYMYMHFTFDPKCPRINKIFY